MTEKNIFACKLFLSLNISDFNLFILVKIGPLPPPPPLKKATPLFPSNPSLKVEVQSSQPFLKILLEVQDSTHPTSSHRPAETGVVHYVTNKIDMQKYVYTEKKGQFEKNCESNLE